MVQVWFDGEVLYVVVYCFVFGFFYGVLYLDLVVVGFGVVIQVIFMGEYLVGQYGCVMFQCNCYC